MRKPKTVDPITLLPFVKDKPNWKPGDGRFPRDFWAVESADAANVAGNSAKGEEFARQALDYILAHGGNPLLGWAVLDMIAKGEQCLADDQSAVIVGFMSEIARYAAYGRKVLKAHEELKPGGMVAIMKDANGKRGFLTAEGVYPETEIRMPVPAIEVAR